MKELRFFCGCSFWGKLLLSVIFSIIIIYLMSMESRRLQILNELSENSLKYVHYKEKTSASLNLTDVKRLINKYNHDEKILNLDIFGELHNNTVILVISVDKLHDPLKYLIASLCDIKGIQETLMVFSHLTYNEELNNFIRDIDFCRVLQIFYPYTLQVYKNEFPGYSNDDCSAKTRVNAGSFECTPDIYGRYRKPSQAEKKHYWWWTANRIFEHLLYSNGLNGIVVFLDDDLFIIKDFLYMVIYMYKLKKSISHCDFINLGLHEWSLQNHTYQVDLTSWDPKYHSGVLIFDVPAWNIIIQHYDLFCYIDDSSWSRSLYYISLNRRDNKKFKVLYTTIPRAIKITACFFNGLYNDCNIFDNFIQAIKMQRYLEINLFPPYLEVYTHIELENDEIVFFDILQGNGGWNDHRDKALCISNITANKIKKILVGMNGGYMQEIF